MNAKLELRNLSKSFPRGKADPIHVVGDFSLHIKNLEFLAVLGPSGCGKSTLLRLIDGLLPADHGHILMDGRDITNVTGGEGRGMVFQSFDLFPWRSTLKNVEFGLEAQGVARAEREDIARHYINLVGLSGFEASYPHELSGGMQQRVGFARALAIKPEVLLMDEPFGALDVQTRDILQNELLDIWEKEQKTVLFVTHSIEEAIYLADRIAVISPRPAKVDHMIEVPFERPRHEAIKSDPKFLEMRQEIWQILKSGVQV
ncbi:ABC transporter ATP-binding protein [Roseibium sediminicola]|uniref:ABC transporter ATP-binding protein n=1 Tax=Roseibium sediminicola TaxID=2933272 RepID=A0ABT0H3A9_9HYPH|nr:ABC transporter ATP-binding protein [Roseibium sp. CAU 1639]MCK7616172.1 ABC transporter ATP-binding protein [Roseibium sp. CAU 1639]